MCVSSSELNFFFHDDEGHKKEVIEKKKDRSDLLLITKDGVCLPIFVKAYTLIENTALIHDDGNHKTDHNKRS